jgi:hypothetical protein
LRTFGSRRLKGHGRGFGLFLISKLLHQLPFGELL